MTRRSGTTRLTGPLPPTRRREAPPVEPRRAPGGLLSRPLRLAAFAVAAGLGGLMLYNLAYITPLVVLLVLASRPGLIRIFNRWHLEHAGGTKLVLAIVVLTLGFTILLTV